jgi:6-pyruvoyltetrahydropterin/6-carboxytetrahydropterin synthase
MTTEFQSTKLIELGSCAFRQWRASHSHCRFLHGYQLKAKIWFSGSSLDDKNWCVDFGSLKELKAKLQHVFDHTTTVAADDPEMATFQELDRKGIIQLRVLDKGVGVERVAEMVHSITNSHVKALTNGRCWVDKVEVFEHEENSAFYNSSYNQPEEATTPLPVIEQIVESVVQQEAPAPPSRAANVGSGPISNNMSNPFAGTSWGA